MSFLWPVSWLLAVNPFMKIFLFFFGVNAVAADLRGDSSTWMIDFRNYSYFAPCLSEAAKTVKIKVTANFARTRMEIRTEMQN